MNLLTGGVRISEEEYTLWWRGVEGMVQVSTRSTNKYKRYKEVQKVQGITKVQVSTISTSKFKKCK